MSQELGAAANTAADPRSPDRRLAAVEREAVGEQLRALRRRLGLSQAGFSERYGIPVANIRQYEIGRTMPPPAVRSYLRVIEADPDGVARTLARST